MMLEDFINMKSVKIMVKIDMMRTSKKNMMKKIRKMNIKEKNFHKIMNKMMGIKVLKIMSDNIMEIGKLKIETMVLKAFLSLYGKR